VTCAPRKPSRCPYIRCKNLLAKWAQCVKREAAKLAHTCINTSHGIVIHIIEFLCAYACKHMIYALLIHIRVGAYIWTHMFIFLFVHIHAYIQIRASIHTCIGMTVTVIAHDG
jgi:hypothetical protein